MKNLTGLTAMSIPFNEKAIIFPDNAIVEVIDISILQKDEKTDAYADIVWRGESIRVIHPTAFESQEQIVSWPKRALVLKAIYNQGFYALALLDTPKLKTIPSSKFTDSVDLEGAMLKAELQYENATFIIPHIKKIEQSCFEER